MYPSLRPILNKGGAGRYVSREESVERLQPIARHHLELLAAYDAALATVDDGPARERLAAVAPYLRTETNKVYETVFSLGGTAPTGAHGSVPAPDLGAKDSDRFRALRDAEGRFASALRDEVDAVHHQERTRAILEHNARASDSRLDVLREIGTALKLV